MDFSCNKGSAINDRGVNKGIKKTTREWFEGGVSVIRLVHIIRL